MPDSGPYEGVLTIPVSIPAAIIDGDSYAEYEALEDQVLAQAEYEFQSLINAFRRVARG